MESRIIIIWAVFALSLAQIFDNEPADPQTFSSFLSGSSLTPEIQESSGCFAPNKTSTKYNVIYRPKTGMLLSLYLVCYDKNSNLPLQSMHQLSPPVQEFTLTTPYSSDKFSRNLIETPPEFYKCPSQINNFKNILGTENQARKFINCNDGHYFVPSNLVPASDFPLEEERRDTQYYINTFPQWKTIKDDNWKNLEKSIREYANTLGRPLMIFGGTLRVAELEDSTGKEQAMYMTRDTSNTPTVAIPRLVWKLVHDHRKYESIVFVIVNNPYRKSIQDLYKYNEVICNCVCDKTVGWFDGWNRTNFSQGYIYCCTLDEFRKSVGLKFLPNTNLLRKKK